MAHIGERPAWIEDAASEIVRLWDHWLAESRQKILDGSSIPGVATHLVQSVESTIDWFHSQHCPQRIPRAGGRQTKESPSGDSQTKGE